MPGQVNEQNYNLLCEDLFKWLSNYHLNYANVLKGIVTCFTIKSLNLSDLRLLIGIREVWFASDPYVWKLPLFLNSYRKQRKLKKKKNLLAMFAQQLRKTIGLF